METAMYVSAHRPAHAEINMLWLSCIFSNEYFTPVMVCFAELGPARASMANIACNTNSTEYTAILNGLKDADTVPNNPRKKRIYMSLKTKNWYFSSVTDLNAAPSSSKRMTIDKKEPSNNPWFCLIKEHNMTNCARTAIKPATGPVAIKCCLNPGISWAVTVKKLPMVDSINKNTMPLKASFCSFRSCGPERKRSINAAAGIK